MFSWKGNEGRQLNITALCAICTWTGGERPVCRRRRKERKKESGKFAKISLRKKIAVHLITKLHKTLKIGYIGSKFPIFCADGISNIRDWRISALALLVGNGFSLPFSSLFPPFPPSEEGEEGKGGKKI